VWDLRQLRVSQLHLGGILSSANLGTRRASVLAGPSFSSYSHPGRIVRSDPSHLVTRLGGLLEFPLISLVGHQRSSLVGVWYNAGACPAKEQ
jgi:hypothetical protein